MGPQGHENELRIALLEIVNTPPRTHIPVGLGGPCRTRGFAGADELILISRCTLTDVRFCKAIGVPLEVLNSCIAACEKD